MCICPAIVLRIKAITLLILLIILSGIEAYHDIKELRLPDLQSAAIIIISLILTLCIMIISIWGILLVKTENIFKLQILFFSLFGFIISKCILWIIATESDIRYLTNIWFKFTVLNAVVSMIIVSLLILSRMLN
ncbi:uncharacterized protein LOC111519778 isoform X2 [Drosophila willistoni]|uniref:uncharacterized protein LOC111519778 isoform X2 n=1 Tax=Drosophila willistoni TaxID=7260 RepID=UPI001F087204|nr:uncharacterized protein LOC111519778 isoform X2 [Drosophila willistoni]